MWNCDLDKVFKVRCKPGRKKWLQRHKKNLSKMINT